VNYFIGYYLKLVVLKFKQNAADFVLLSKQVKNNHFFAGKR
jgi:hypothetical protein